MNKSVKQLHQGRMKMWEESMSNHARYIDAETGLFDEKYVEERACPVCRSNQPVHLFDKAGGTYVKCGRCAMVYLNPVLKDEELTAYYNLNHTVQSEIVENDPDNFYSKIYSQGIGSIRQALPGAKTILDIGCSSGVFLDIARDEGLETYGIELNNKEMEIARRKGHRVYNEQLEHIDFPVKFDVITLWDVFEHIKNGGVYLAMIKQMLAPNGVLFMQIPSSDALAAKILQEKCNMFDGLEHVNLYGTATIETLAHSAGFEIIDLKTVISEIGVINNYLNYDDPYLGDTTNTGCIPHLLNEDELHKARLGYKMQISLRGVRS